MSWFQHMLRIARAVLQSVIQRMTEQINIMDQQAKSPINQMIQEVAGGSIWRGKGAQAFQDEMFKAVSSLTRIIGASERYRNNIQRAADTVDAADVKCRSLADNLRSTIEQI